jgi:predicted Rossmann-fold nucleotide-binding protein
MESEANAAMRALNRFLFSHGIKVIGIAPSIDENNGLMPLV